jgi:hypothetical protein
VQQEEINKGKQHKSKKAGEITFGFHQQFLES